MARLDGAYWWLTGVASVLTLARFSEAFLLLLAKQVGMPIALIPGVLMTMNVVYAAAAYPFGRLSDGMSRRTLLVLGTGFLVAADLVLANAPTAWHVLLGAALWGLHMGATQGLLSTLVVDSAPADLRGTALGLYNLVTGVVLLAASVLAGALWTGVGPGSTFMAGAIFATAAAIAIALKAQKVRLAGD